MTQQHKIYEFMNNNGFNFIDSRRRINLKQFLVYEYVKFINLNDDLELLLNISIYDRNKTLIIVCSNNNKNEVFNLNHLGHSFISYRDEKTLTISLRDNDIFIPTKITTEYKVPDSFYAFSVLFSSLTFALGYFISEIIK